jgi:hypothetical protein
LEVADKHHRYSKNLRLYFKEYGKIFGLDSVIEQIHSAKQKGCNKHSCYDPFFAWLDSVADTKPDVSD